jgi:hypothetical protein
MTISPLCTVNGFQTLDGVDVTGASTVTIQLATLAGVKQWSIQCIATDDINTVADINATLIPNINYVTKTATFTAPSAPNGSAMIFQSQVNNGQDGNGRTDASLTTRFGIFVLTGGGNRVFAFDERMESNHTFGWLKKINDLIRAVALDPAGQAGAGLTYVAGAYNVVAANNSIVVNADSIELSPSYKIVLDQATDLSNSDTLALRDEFGDIHFHDLYADNNLNVAGDASITNGLSVSGSTNLKLTFATQYVLKDNSNTNILNIVRNGSTSVDIQNINNSHALRLFTAAISGSDSKSIDIFTGATATAAMNSGALTLNSGTVNGAGAVSGQLSVKSGAATTGSSGPALYGSGNAATGNTGSVTLFSGAVTTSGNTGNVSIGTGSTALGTTGNLTLSSGNTSSATAGNVNVVSGNGTVKGGDVNITAGNGTNGNGGHVKIKPGLLGTAAARYGNIYLGRLDPGVNLTNTNCGGVVFLSTADMQGNIAGNLLTPVNGISIVTDGTNMYFKNTSGVLKQVMTM